MLLDSSQEFCKPCYSNQASFRGIVGYKQLHLWTELADTPTNLALRVGAEEKFIRQGIRGDILYV